MCRTDIIRILFKDLPLPEEEEEMDQIENSGVVERTSDQYSASQIKTNTNQCDNNLITSSINMLNNIDFNINTSNFNGQVMDQQFHNYNQYVNMTAEQNNTRDYSYGNCQLPTATIPTPEKIKTKRTRTYFSATQLLAMELEFNKNQYLCRARRIQISQAINLPERQIKVWFQNRRMKFKKQMKEGESPQVNNGLENPKKFTSLVSPPLSEMTSFNQQIPIHNVNQPEAYGYFQQPYNYTYNYTYNYNYIDQPYIPNGGMIYRNLKPMPTESQMVDQILDMEKDLYETCTQSIF